MAAAGAPLLTRGVLEGARWINRCQEGGLEEPIGSRMVLEGSRNGQEGKMMDKEGIEMCQEGKRGVRGTK